MMDMVKVDSALDSSNTDLFAEARSGIIRVTHGGAVPRKSSDSQETYGEWLARAPDAELSSAELRERRARQAWEKTDVRRVTRLDRCVGKVYVLREDMGTVACDMQASVAERVERGVYGGECDVDLGKSVMGWPAGTRIRIFARCGDRLLGRTDTEIVLSVVPEWLRLMPSERVFQTRPIADMPAPSARAKSPTVRPAPVKREPTMGFDYLMAPLPKRRSAWGQATIALSL
jgi:hypothetical protein